MLSYDPGYFVGRLVHKRFNAGTTNEEGVYEGTIIDYDQQRDAGVDPLTGGPRHVFGIRYTDGHEEDYDHEDMIAYGIESRDGLIPLGGGTRSHAREEHDVEDDDEDSKTDGAVRSGSVSGSRDSVSPGGGQVTIASELTRGLSMKCCS